MDEKNVQKKEVFLPEFLSEEMIRAILNTALNGIIVADHRGIMQLFNPAAEKIFGYGESGQ